MVTVADGTPRGAARLARERGVRVPMLDPSR
jgi:hypothetical protein